MLAALLTLVRSKIENKRMLLISSLCLYGAALLSKETAIAALPIFALVWWLIANQDKTEPASDRLRGALRIAAWYTIPAALYLAGRWFVLGGIGIEEGKRGYREVFLSSPDIIAFYLQKLIWPIGLAGFCANTPSCWMTVYVCLTIVVLLLGLGLFIWLTYRFSGLFALAGAVIVLPLLPVIVGIRVFDQGNLTHDRYLYLPSMGLCLLLSLGVKKAWPNVRARSVTLVVCVPVMAVLAYLTVRQQRFYHNDEAFYRRAIEVGPQNALVMGYLGDLLLEDGDNERALEWFERGVKTAPNDPNAKFHLARGLMETRQFSAAVTYLKDLGYGTQPIAPRRRSAILLSLANAQLQLNQPEAAEQTLLDLATFDFRFPGLHRTLGILFQRVARIEEAQREYALEFQISSDAESRRQAVAPARRFASAEPLSHP